MGAVLGVIPARGGSKRVPKKNIKALGDKPLIAWTIEAAKQSKLLDFFLVSTDAPDIARISKKYGAAVPFKRPASISEDVDTVEVFIHALNWFEEATGTSVDWIVGLQPTSPFRTTDDIDTCIQIAQTTENADSVISVVKVNQHPYWCLERDLNQRLRPFMGEGFLKGEMLISQNLPLIEYPNGAVYVTRRDLILSGRIFGDTMYGYRMPPERSVDLESHLDFLVASSLLAIMEAQKGDPALKISWIVA